MKTLKLFLIFISVFSYSFSQNTNETELPGFRNFEWGVSPEKVKENESARYLQTFSGFGTYVLSFRGDFLQLNSRIDYSFKDSMLVEGSYQIGTDFTYETDFIKIRDHFTKLYGKPAYWAITKFDSKPRWIKQSDLGSFRGPELFWEFEDGFIAIQSSKYIEEITITVLYVHNQEISEYGNADVFTIQY